MSNDARNRPAAEATRTGRRIAAGLGALFARLTPYTSEAFVNAPVAGIAPNVSGAIVDVVASDNKPVAAGDTLFTIDPRRFEAAVAQAEASLAAASQQVGANTAALAAAEARLAEARARLTNQREQTDRVLQLVQRKVYAQAQADTARAQLATAEAGVAGAEAGLAEARQRLGPNGVENPQIQLALAQLQRARIDLADTVVKAPVDGVVTNTNLVAGQFAAAGRRVATIVDTADGWIVAHIPENSLARIVEGDRVLVTFNAQPGRIHEARVVGIAAGVAQSATDALPGDLQYVSARRTWLRETRRIPVRIELEEGAQTAAIRGGSRAAVVVVTRDAGLWAYAGHAWLKIVAIADYAF